MNKLTTFILASTLSVSLTAAPKSQQHAEFYSNQIENVIACASTNLTLAQARFRHDFKTLTRKPELHELVLRADPRLARLGLFTDWRYVSLEGNPLPLCASNAAVRANAYALAPTRISIAAKYGVVASTYDIFKTDITFEETIAWLSECCDGDGLDVTGTMGYIKKNVQKKADKAVKQYLRNKGRSFVVKNGVDPCADYLQRLNTSLNAGYLDGLNAWLSEIGVTNRVDISKLPSAHEINKLKHDILFYEKPFDRNSRYLLLLCLGTDGYNAFVKEYNGDN